jgi:hypothetical protein
MDWPRTHFSSDAMHWWRANWQALPAQGAVREISAEIETTPVTKRAISPGDFAWVMTETDEWAPCVAIESDSTEDFYDIDAAYEEARISLDPSLSPHGAFRALEHGNHAAAVEFTNRFGLLSLPVPGPSLHGGACAPFFRVRDRRWMNLDHFWSRHARYVAISALWEPYSGSGPGTLPQAWAQLIARLDEINKLGPSLLDPTDDVRVLTWKDFPIYADKNALREWLRHPGRQGLMRSMILGTVEREINLHASDCQPWWHRIEKSGKIGFALALSTMSLWAAIWQLFARDTLGVGWRVCPHCNKIFYPPRKDRFYCTPEIQQHQSKRAWDKRKRRQDRRTKKERRR